MTLVADAQGIVRGKFTIPASIPSGNKSVFALGAGGSYGQAIFSGQGTRERQTWQQQTTITETRWQSPPPPAPVFVPEPDVVAWTRPADTPWVNTFDPIAQTFTLDSNQQITGVDLWFVDAPTTPPTIQIRATTAGLPNAEIIAETSLGLDALVTGGGHTRAVFPSPVSLLGGSEYALVILCNDATGSVAVAQLGDFDQSAQQWVSSQPYTVGVLLSSSNASTWTAHQDRDLTFRLLRASYSPTSRTVNLGNVSVTDATDLLLMSYAERPASAANVQYTLSLPGGQSVVVSDGQPVQLAAPISGSVGVTATLTGTERFSPILFPGTQLVSGTVAETADYVTRAVPAGTGVRIKVIYEAVVPSGATVKAKFKGVDLSDTWSADISVTSTRNVDDGFVEFVHEISGVTETAIQVKLILSGNTAARPRVRDLRIIVL